MNLKEKREKHRERIKGRKGKGGLLQLNTISKNIKKDIRKNK